MLVRLLLVGILATLAPAGEVGTSAEREALFEQLLQKTLNREAFSPIKYERLGLDPKAELEACRTDFLSATDEVQLYYALVRLSAARRDRHLYVRPAKDGITPGAAFRALHAKMGHPEAERLEAPLHFRAGFRPDGPEMFVSERAEHAYTTTPALGDRVTHVNGEPLNAFVAQVEPYWRYSTRENMWMRLARDLSRVTPNLPPWLYRDNLQLQLQRKDGSRYELVLPYLPADQITWQTQQRAYPGFERVLRFPTFDVFAPTDERALLLLQWHAFDRELLGSVNRLMKEARERDWLKRDLILDCTRASGGSRGAYALQRFTARPFKLTFGNLRMSDITPAFARQRIADTGFSIPFGRDLDSGKWVKAWLKVVLAQHADGQAYSDNVPFKCAHAPHDADGILQPAPLHFQGRLVCWFGPQGGSHLDQFAAMVIDNKLGHTLGMPTGGYSNTWEYTEVIHLPGSRRPLVRFMWTIGHTLRPNGQILEGNPAAVSDRQPPTSDTVGVYEAQLLERTLRFLAQPEGP